MKRFAILLLALVCAFGTLYAGGGSDANAPYPNNIIQMIVPFGAGGGADISVRLLTNYMEDILGQRIVIQNVSGGSGTIGFSQIASAKPDGYTLGYFASTNSNDSRLFQGVTYGVDDFTPICMYSNDAHVIVVGKNSGIENMEDLIAAAKAKPETITFGLGGAWTSHDFLRISLEEATGVKFKRMVFQGGTAAVTAVAGGNCDVAVPFVSEALAQIQAGNVIPIAITSEERFELLPDVPTCKESGLDFVHTMWRGFVGPAGLPDEVITTIDNAVKQVFENPEYIQENLDAGTYSQYMGHEEFAQFYLDNHEQYLELIESEGL